MFIVRIRQGQAMYLTYFSVEQILAITTSITVWTSYDQCFLP